MDGRKARHYFHRLWIGLPCGLEQPPRLRNSFGGLGHAELGFGAQQGVKRHGILPSDRDNAAQDEHEAEIIARAGDAGQITVATNMAGRGVDIRLGEGVAERGGLYVILSERTMPGGSTASSWGAVDAKASRAPRKPLFRSKIPF